MVTRWKSRQLLCPIQINIFWRNDSDKGGLEILYDCADGIDRDGDLDLADGELDAYRDKKSAKEINQFEVAIGDGMEFTIHGKRIEENEYFLDPVIEHFSSILLNFSSVKPLQGEGWINFDSYRCFMFIIL